MEDEDYTVTYTDSTGAVVEAPSEVGTYTITVEGKGNYKGTLTYSFEIIQSYSVSYNANGGEGDLPESHIYASGDEVPVYGASLTRDGYTFAGWATSSTATAAEYVAGDTLTVGSKDVVLYAVWLKQIDKPVSENRVYNSSEQTGVPAGEGYTLSGDYKATNAASYTATATLNAGYIWSDKTSDPVNLTWKIDPKAVTVTVTGNTGSEVYTGLEQSVTGYEVEIPEGVDFTKEDVVFSGTATATGTHVGTHAMGLASEQFSVDDDNYTVTFAVTDGSLAITKAPVTITTESGTKTYDGTALTAGGTISGLQNGETVTFTVTGTQTAVGSSFNTYTLAWDGTALETDYEITSITRGTLTVNEYADVITVTTTGGSFTYDGQVHGATVAVSELPTGYTVETATSSAAATDVTTMPVVATCDTLVIRNAAGEDVTSKLNITYVPGTITVTPAQLNVVTNAGIKVYDSTPLTADGSLTGLVEGETATLVTTGSQTDVGKSGNTYEIQWGTAKESNYEIASAAIGMLEVEPAPVTVTPVDASKTYGDDDPGLTATGTGTFGSDTVSYELSRVEGENVGTYEISATGERIQDNYSVSFGTGTFTINPKAINVAITGNDDTVTYNGVEQSVTGYGVVIPVGVDFAESDVNFTGDATAKGTDVGTYDMGLAAEQFSSTNKNYTVTFAVTDGSLEITPAAVTVTPVDKSKTYGDADPEFTADVTGLIGEDKINYTVARAAGENVGTYEISATGEATQGNYTVTFADPATFTINPRAITVTVVGNTDSKTYNGSEQSVTGYEVTIPEIELATGTAFVEDDIKFTGTDTAKGTNAGSYPMGLSAEQFSSTNKNYTVTFSVTDGSLTINPKAVTVTPIHTLKTYGNNDPELTAAVTGTVGSDTLEYTLTREPGENVGDYTITATGEEVQGNYTVTYETGTFTITPRLLNVTIAGNTGTKTYSGSEQSVTGYEVTIPDSGLSVGEPFVESDIAFSGTDAAKGTDAGIYPMGLAVDQFSSKNANYSVTFHVTDGSLTITKAPLSVTTESASKVYDGTALTAPGELDGLVAGETATFTVTGSQTAVGSSENSYTLEWNGTAKESNYEVKNESLGTLTVNEYAGTVTVTTTGGTFTYDGKAHGATVEVSGLPTGYTVQTATSSATATDVTAQPVEATCDDLVIVNAAGEDVTSKLDVAYVGGTITVTPAPLTVVTESASKTYDGTALTAGGTLTGLVNGETATLTTTGSQTNVGKSDNTYEIQWGTAKASNYAIDETVGELEVVPLVVTVIADDLSKTYGDADPELTVVIRAEGGADIDESLISYEISRETGEDVGKYQIAVTGDKAQGNYEVYFVNALLTINPKAITITPADATKTYGDADPELTWDVEGLVSGDTKDDLGTVTVTRETGDNVGTYAITASGASNNNYTISYNTGTFRITPKTITVSITGSTDSKVYTGLEQSVTGYEVEIPEIELETGTAFVEGDIDFTGDATAARTHVGTSAMGLAADQFSSKNDNYAVSFNIVSDGSLEITKAPLTITTESASRAYDGTALTANGTLDGLVNGETATFTVTGSQTNVGKSDNTCTLVWDGTALGSDYKIASTDIGELEVTPAQVTVTPVDKSKTYGDADPELTATVTGTVGSDTVSYELSREAGENAGTYEISATGEPTQGNYAVAFGTGTLTINAADFTVEPLADVTYNGSQQEQAPTVKGVGGAVLEDGTDYTVSYGGDTTNAGTVTVTVTGKGNYAGTQTVSYEIERVPVTVTLTGNTRTVTYTGTEQSFGNYTVSIDDPSHTSTHGIYEIVDSPDATGTDAGTYAMGWTEDDIAPSATSGNYDITFKVIDGSLTIEPAEISVTTESASKVYDGTALTAPDEISGLQNGETATFTVTGSQTAVGSSENSYTLVWDGTAKESNYTLASEVLGTLTVTEYADEITVTTTGGTFAYDGKAHGATVEVSGLPTGYTVQTATSSATATDVTAQPVEATCDDLVIVNAAGEDVTSKLNITLVPGTITITPAQLTVVTESASKTYDGTPLTAGGTLTGLVEGETATLTATGSQTDVGKSDNGYEIEWGTAKESNYEVASETIGELEVTPAQVTVTPDDKSKTYGDADPELTADVEGLIGSDTVSYELSREAGENAGTYEISATGEPTQGNYAVAFGTGTLTINAADFTVESLDDVTYNSSPQEQAPTVTGVGGAVLEEDTDYTVSYGGDTTNAGTVTVTVTGKGNYAGASGTVTYDIVPAQIDVPRASTDNIYDTDEQTGVAPGDHYSVENGSGINAGSYTAIVRLDDKRNYVWKLADGTTTTEDQEIPWEIIPSPNFYPSSPGDVTYDGEQHFQPIDVMGLWFATLVEGTDYTLAYEGDVINVGEVTVVVTAKGNYAGVKSVTYRIRPAEFTVDSLPDVTYNGSPQEQAPTVKGVNDTTLVEGTDYTVSYSDDTTNVGTVMVTVTGEGNYAGTKSVTYNIVPAEVTVPTAATGLVYNGSEQTGVADGDHYSVTWGSARDAGSYTAVASLDDDKNYVWKLADGSTTNADQSIDWSIAPADFTVDPIDNVTYNGSPQQVGPTVTGVGGTTLVEGTDYTVAYDGPAINVGPVTVTVTGEGNYTGTKSVTYLILPKGVDVPTALTGLVYNGSEQTGVEAVANLYTVTGGSATDAGDYTAVASLVDKVNYVWNLLDGSTTADDQSIGWSIAPLTTFTVGDISDVTYNGSKQEQSPTVTGVNGAVLVEGTDYTVSYEGDTTNAGTVTVNVTGEGNYTGIRTASYQIAPAPLTITTESASKTYDGSALTAGGTITGLVNGETVTFTVTGSQTTVGSSSNTYRITWNGTAKQGNYVIGSESLGTLTVNAAPTPTPPTPPTPTPAPTPTTPTTSTTTTPTQTTSITDNPTPQAQNIDDNPTPQAKGETADTWSLFDLLAAILAVILSIGLLAGLRRKDADDDTIAKRKNVIRGISVIPAVGAIIALFLTQDFTQAMAIPDEWSIMFGIIAAVEVALVAAGVVSTKGSDQKPE